MNAERTALERIVVAEIGSHRHCGVVDAILNAGYRKRDPDEPTLAQLRQRLPDLKTYAFRDHHGCHATVMLRDVYAMLGMKSDAAFRFGDPVIPESALRSEHGDVHLYVRRFGDSHELATRSGGVIVWPGELRRATDDEIAAARE